jgi:hypothetical protein
VSETSARTFITCAAPFSTSSTFTVNTFKKYGSLTPEYCERFVKWVAAGDTKTTERTVNHKLRDLKFGMKVVKTFLKKEKLESRKRPRS